MADDRQGIGDIGAGAAESSADAADSGRPPVVNRAAVKAGIVSAGQDDPELERERRSAKDLQQLLASHTHDQKMRDKELGWLGGLIGGERNAPLTVAAVAFVASLTVFCVIQVMVVLGYVAEPRVAAAVSAADKCLALATLALGYVCGKSGGSS